MSGAEGGKGGVTSEDTDTMAGGKQLMDGLVDHCRNSGSFLFVWVKSDATEGF